MRTYLECDNGYREIESWGPEGPQWTPGVWINVESPDNADFDFLTHCLDIPEDFLTYTADPDENPRMEQDGKWTLTILRVPMETPADDVPFATVPVGIISDSKIVVTVSYHHTEVLDEFIAHSRHKAIAVPSPADFVLYLIYCASSWFLNYLKQISDAVNGAERALQRSVRNKDLMQLMQLGKALVYFNTSLRGDETVIDRLRHTYPDGIDPDLLEDVTIELRQAINTVNIYTDILNTSTDTFASIISNNVNEIMKRMTAITIVLMIPTGIASFYGMNVGIGLSSNPWAFWIIVGVAAVITLLAVLALRLLRWF